jgi:hypothetical protein
VFPVPPEGGLHWFDAQLPASPKGPGITRQFDPTELREILKSLDAVCKAFPVVGRA